jgi:hypothetical protein
MTETHPEKRLIGYARVSTYGQALDSQLDQLRKAGCTSRNIYREKVTGARADRRELNRMLGKLTPGDVVTVTRIDRLARSTFDLFAIVKRIVDAKAQFRSLAEPWADTGTSTGRLMLASRRTGRRRARSYPHPHRRRPEPRQGPRKAHGPTPCPHTPNRKRRSCGARRARRSTNSPAATMLAAPRFHGSPPSPHYADRLAEIIRFRMLMIAAGYEDGNDADTGGFR